MADSNHLKEKILSCKCTRCRAISSLVEHAKARLVFSEKSAGRLCEFAVVGAAGRHGIEEQVIPQERRRYASHLGVKLSGPVSDSETASHIDWAVRHSNHDSNESNRVNLGTAVAKKAGSRYTLTFLNGKSLVNDD